MKSNRVESRKAEQSRAEPSRAEMRRGCSIDKLEVTEASEAPLRSRVGPSRAEPSRAASSCIEPGRGRSSCPFSGRCTLSNQQLSKQPCGFALIEEERSIERKTVVVYIVLDVWPEI